MKSNFILLALLILGSLTACQEKQPEKQQITTPEKMLRHAVLFKFKDDAPAEDVKKVENTFRALPSQIKEIKSFEWGKNNSPEGLDQGFTHCFFVTFSSEKDRETYLPHPAHQAFVEVLKPHLDKVLVLDYWAEQ